MTAATSAPAAAIVLEATNLAVQYDRAQRAALSGVDLVLRRGDRVALLGPSGGGKTTLLRALEGSVALSEGSITRHGPGVLIYQDLRLVAEQSVLNNVCAGAFGELQPFDGLVRFPAPICARAMELLEDLGLMNLADRRVSTLSGGQRQRVAIARALCARPAVLLADEPMASLDPENAARILALLRRLQEKHGFALVLSLHDPGPDPKFFQRYMVIANGEVERVTDLCEDAWRIFAVSRRLACGVDEEPRAIQDEPMEPDRPLLRRTAKVATAVMVLALLMWALRGIDTRGTSVGGSVDALRDFGQRLVPNSWAELKALPWARLFRSLVETIQMAIIGTAIGVVASLPLAVLASRATAPRWVRTPMRLLLNVIRTVPAIFWALFFVIIVGLGPVAGVLGLAAYSVGYLTKFFYEGLEDTDSRPAEALRALGGNRLQVFLRANLPAARPVLVASCLFVLEYNVRSASILGIVGAGGIGQDLMYHLEWREFPAAMAGLLMILVVVVALDYLSQWWRKRLVRQRGT